MFVDFFVLIFDFNSISSHFNSTAKLHRLYLFCLFTFFLILDDKDYICIL